MKKILLSLLLFIPIAFTNSCGELKAAEPAEIECKYLNAWDFKRCENSEVICYTNGDGLSCKWK